MGDNLCFVAGTEIKTDEGYKNIEEIHAGDLVYAKNTETGEEGYKEVVRVFVKDSDELIHLTIGDEEITTTSSHPFYVVGEGFVEAGELEIGDEVETADGERLFVTDIRYEYLDVPVTVYNFEVADWHTYYVSDEDVLVHNVCHTEVSRKQALTQIKRDLGIAKNQHPVSQKMVTLRDKNKNPIVRNGKIVKSREMTYYVKGFRDQSGTPIDKVVIQDHSNGHDYGGKGDQPSHYNVRPITNVNNGSVLGIKDHYYFDYRNK